MIIEFDLAKSDRNARKRGLPFERADEFDWDTALIIEDTRRDYGEPRFRAFGFIGDR
ncbi:MAG: BrnT family toxin, partial [bacterium]